MAVSAHETGHAMQDADDYAPMELRTALAPIAQAGSRFGIPLAIVGSVFGMPLLVQIGMLAYLGALLLFFLTLPVEFNASKRALAELKRLGFTTPEDEAAATILFLALCATAPDAEVALDTPEDNTAAVALATRFSLAPVFETARMYRGPAPELPVQRTFGITTFELG